MAFCGAGITPHGPPPCPPPVAGTTTLFSGDTLFRGGVGRWDLGGTSLEDIVASIRTKLFVYPDEARVICGHGPPTTIGTERASNPFLV